MLRSTLKVFFLFGLLVMLPATGFLNQTHGYGPGSGNAVRTAGSAFEAVRLEPEIPGTSGLEQYEAAGHIINFQGRDVVIAAGTHALRIEYLGAHTVLPTFGNGRSSDKSGDIQPLEKATYHDLWDGISVELEKADLGVVKSTYYIQAEENRMASRVDDIRLRYNVPVKMDGSGNLVLTFATGEMRESRPVAWQEIGGKRTPVEAGYRLLGEREVGFEVGGYDPQYSLVIDPILSWNTFLGGDGADHSYGIVSDIYSNLYVVGTSDVTWGSPVTPHSGGNDVFVAKLNAAGTLQWNTFMAGPNGVSEAGIAVDLEGKVYVISSRHVSENQYAFVAALSADGAPQWTTFLGGSGYNEGVGIVLGTQGNIYVVGYSNATWGTPLNPFTAGNDAFVAMLSGPGILQWNTFLGASDSDDLAGEVSIDNAGNVYVTGSSNATWGSPVRSYGGGNDAFVAKLSTSGLLQWNTFVGGQYNDLGKGIALDTSGNVYVAGESSGTWGTPVRAFADSYDAFAAKINEDGVLQWHTFLGGSGVDTGTGIGVNYNGKVFVAGFSYSTWGTPLMPYQLYYDYFAAGLNESGELLWNAFVGARATDYCYGMTLDPDGGILLTGQSDREWGSPVRGYTAGWDVSVVKLATPFKQDLVGTWDGQGGYNRDSESGAWTILSSPAERVVCGDINGDQTDDLIGDWPAQGGIWVKYSNSGSWAPLLATARDMAVGHMSGGARADLIVTWDGQGVFYRDSNYGNLVQLASPAEKVAAGDLDGDKIDDLIGLWSAQGGIWVKYSETGLWEYLSSPARDFAAGDMNGDGRDDLVGTWDGQGVFYRDSISGGWVQMASSAEQVTAGDLDGDAVDDLIGLWTAQGGIWVKYYLSGGWEYLASPARDITVGKMAGGLWTLALNESLRLSGPLGGYPEAPPGMAKGRNMSALSPRGGRPASQRGKNLIPHQTRTDITRIPGPMEAGFSPTAQKDLVPRVAQEARPRKDFKGHK